MKITKDMLIGQILRDYPETAGILQSFGMGCVYCPSAQGESIEQAAMVHGLNLDALIEALNK
jgi:hybrid cluster-associated redox disulfide protein